MDTLKCCQPALLTAYEPMKSLHEIADSFWRTVLVRAQLAQWKESLDDKDKFYLAAAAGVPFKSESETHEDGHKVVLRMTTSLCNFVRDPDRGWLCYYKA